MQKKFMNCSYVFRIFSILILTAIALISSGCGDYPSSGTLCTIIANKVYSSSGVKMNVNYLKINQKYRDGNKVHINYLAAGEATRTNGTTFHHTDSGELVLLRNDDGEWILLGY